MDLRDIRGIGEKRIKKLSDAGIFHPLDLLLHFPYKYADLSRTLDFSGLSDGEEIAFCGEVEGDPVTKFVRRGLSFVKAKFRVGQDLVGCTWFNQRFLARRLVAGKQFCVSGRVKKFRHSFDVSAPILSEVPKDGQRIIPLYRSIKGLPLPVLTEAIQSVLSSVRVNSYLSPLLASEHGLMPLNEAFCALHRPKSMEQMRLSARTIAIENLSNSLCLFSIMKRKNAQNRTFSYQENREALNLVIKSLPFKLTEDQQKAIQEIVDSLHGGAQTNRLLQGDVGCGKTIVAFLIMYYAKLSGYQSALMAPTELLARQHYVGAIRILGDTGVKICLLTGSMAKAERDNALFYIQTGMADMVIGTHALIEEDVRFARLSLVITDEQHRFGVNQRGKLENKAFGTDTLVMSATPIPRTLALTLYGDLEQSVIHALPVGKAKTLTRKVPSYKADDMLGYIEQKALQGEQSYLVCPRIADEEDGLLAAETLFNRIQKRFSVYGIALLHGQMRDSDKNEVMARFAAGELKVLVATTVIEVGIDVPNATTMVIYHAERYGLSQLHQLRGRVGRGTQESYCFLLSDNENTATQERLQFFCNCSDGFELAEYDFQLRGAGDFIGTRQHGDSNSLPPISIDAMLIGTAKQIAESMLRDEEICRRITADTGERGCEYINSLTLN